MYLNYIKVINFKNIKEKELYFSKINIFNGDNGKGKTAILEAITYALTNHLEDKIESYVRRGKNLKFFEIFLEFQNKEIVYNLYIKAGKTTHKELKFNDELYKGKDATTILKTLIDPDIALFSNISIQGKSTQLLFENKASRLEKLKKIFKISDADKAVENIETDIKEIKEDLKVNEAELNILKEIQYNIEPEEEEINLDSLNDKIKQEENLKSIYEKDEIIYNRYLGDLETYNNSLTTKTDLESNLKFKEQELEEKSIKLLENKLPDFDSDYFSNLKDTVNKNSLELKDFENKLENKNNLEKDLNIIESELNKIQNNISSIDVVRLGSIDQEKDELDKLVTEQNDIRYKITTLEKEKLLAKQGKCPTCGSTDGIFVTPIEDFDKQISLLSGLSVEITDKIKQLNEEIELYNKKVENNKLNKHKLELLENQAEDLIKKKDSIITKLQVYSSISFEEVKEKSLIIDKQKEEIELLKEKEDNYFKIKRIITDLENYINIINNSISMLKNSLETYKDLKEPVKVEKPEKCYNEELLQKYNQDLKKGEEHNIKVKIVKENNIKVLKEKKKNDYKISEKSIYIDNKRHELEILETTRQLIKKDFISYLIDKGTLFVKYKMNEIFSKTYGQYFVTLEKDKSGVDFLYGESSDGELASVNLASGYEKQVLSLSFRLALSYLHNNRLFIFDEIDSEASEENSLRFYESFINYNFDQLFCITHKNFSKEFLITNNHSKVINL